MKGAIAIQQRSSRSGALPGKQRALRDACREWCGSTVERHRGVIDSVTRTGYRETMPIPSRSMPSHVTLVFLLGSCLLGSVACGSDAASGGGATSGSSGRPLTYVRTKGKLSGRYEEEF